MRANLSFRARRRREYDPRRVRDSTRFSTMIRGGAWAMAAILSSACAHRTAAETYREDGLAPYRERGLPVVDERDAQQRVAFIQRTLDRIQPAERIWRYGWIIGFSTLAVGSAIRPAIFGINELPAGIVGGTGSLLGLASVLVNDEHGSHAADDLRGYLSRTSDPWSIRLRTAEQAFRECARVEAFVGSWPAQLARAAVGFGSWAIITFAANQPQSGAINLGAGLVIGQLSNITHPRGMVDAWNRYVSHHADVEGRHIPWSRANEMRWAIVPGSAGPQVIVSF